LYRIAKNNLVDYYRGHKNDLNVDDIWYLEDDTDIESSADRKLKLDKLLKYNVIDTLSTNYVKETYYQEVIDSKQEETYKTLMLDTVRLLLITELSGMPINMDRVK